MIDSKKRYHIIVVCDWKRNYHYRRVFKPMPETEGNELSVDELKDVSGGGMGLDRLGSNKIKGDGGLGGLGNRTDSVVGKSRRSVAEWRTIKEELRTLAENLLRQRKGLG